MNKRSTNQIISFCLTLAMILTMWSGMPLTASADVGSVSDDYQITGATTSTAAMTGVWASGTGITLVSGDALHLKNTTPDAVTITLSGIGRFVIDGQGKTFENLHIVAEDDADLTISNITMSAATTAIELKGDDNKLALNNCTISGGLIAIKATNTVIEGQNRVRINGGIVDGGNLTVSGLVVSSSGIKALDATNGNIVLSGNNEIAVHSGGLDAIYAMNVIMLNGNLYVNASGGRNAIRATTNMALTGQNVTVTGGGAATLDNDNGLKAGLNININLTGDLVAVGGKGSGIFAGASATIKANNISVSGGSGFDGTGGKGIYTADFLSINANSILANGGNATTDGGVAIWGDDGVSITAVSVEATGGNGTNAKGGRGIAGSEGVTSYVNISAGSILAKGGNGPTNGGKAIIAYTEVNLTSPAITVRGGDGDINGGAGVYVNNGIIGITGAADISSGNANIGFSDYGLHGGATGQTYLTITGSSNIRSGNSTGGAANVALHTNQIHINNTAPLTIQGGNAGVYDNSTVNAALNIAGGSINLSSITGTGIIHWIGGTSGGAMSMPALISGSQELSHDGIQNANWYVITTTAAAGNSATIAAISFAPKAPVNIRVNHLMGSNLQEGNSNVGAGTTIVTLQGSTFGGLTYGTPYWTYNLGGASAAAFLLSGTSIIASPSALTAGAYNITVSATYKDDLLTPAGITTTKAILISVAAKAVLGSTDTSESGSSVSGSGSTSTGGSNPFDRITDIPADHWAADAIEYVMDRGIMEGTGNNKFSPALQANRAMVVKTLANKEKVFENMYKSSPYIDVKIGEWYGPAVAWGTEKKIVFGVGHNKFEPMRQITRQEMAAVLYRYSIFKGKDVTTKAELNKFTDKEQVASWAKPAMIWAVEKGIFSGRPNNILDPRGMATRAELATILYKYSQMK